MSRRATEQFNYLLKIKLTTTHDWNLSIRGYCAFFTRYLLISALLFEDSA